MLWCWIKMQNREYGPGRHGYGMGQVSKEKGAPDRGHWRRHPTPGEGVRDVRYDPGNDAQGHARDRGRWRVPRQPCGDAGGGHIQRERSRGGAGLAPGSHEKGPGGRMENRHIPPRIPGPQGRKIFRPLMMLSAMREAEATKEDPDPLKGYQPPPPSSRRCCLRCCCSSPSSSVVIKLTSPRRSASTSTRPPEKL